MRGSVNGYVVRADGRPVPNATITILRGAGPLPDLAPLTDEEGRFALDGLQSGRWLLRAIGAGGGQGEAEVPVFENAVSEVVIELNGLHRWLADALTGISDGTADIASDGPSGHAAGGRAGLLQDAGSPAAPYGANDAEIPMPGSARRREVRRGDKAEVAMPGSIRGHVVRAETGEPVANAAVSVVRGSAPAPDMAPMTDAAGRFVLDGLHPGMWLLRALGPDGEMGEAEVRVQDHMPAAVVIEVMRAAGATGSILGRALRADNGMPVPDAEVHVLRSGHRAPGLSAQTDPAGRFSIEGLAAGTWLVRGLGADGAVGETEVSVLEDTFVHAVIELECRRSVTGRLDGRVVRADTGKPVPNATVSLVHGPGPAPDIAPLSDDAGNFSGGELAEGIWLLRALGPDGEQGEAEVQVRAGARALVNIKVDRPTLVRELIGRECRVYREGDALTEDFRLERVNIELDRTGSTLRGVWFG